MKDKRLLAIMRSISTSYGKFFLGVICFFTLLFIAYLFYANWTLKQSQEKIKSSYADHIEKIDNYYYRLLSYNKELANNIQEINNAYLADSMRLFGMNHKLSNKQSENLSAAVSNHLNQLDKLQEQYFNKLSRDSIWLNSERVLLEGQVKSMVDLHLSKIDNEYNIITIWAAILTILFLVFSFYSIFKMDELIQQGREGIRDINELKKKGEKSIDNFIDDSKERQRNLDRDLDNIKSEYLNKIAKFEEQNRERIDVFMKDYETRKSKYENMIDSKVESINTLMELINKKLNNKEDEEGDDHE